MDGHVLGKEENLYTGEDYGTYGCGNIGEDFIGDVCALLLVPLFTYWLSIGDAIIFTNSLVPFVSIFELCSWNVSFDVCPILPGLFCFRSLDNFGRKLTWDLLLGLTYGYGITMGACCPG